MSDKKKRSVAGLPWIAAMAFFMQALDATILNTALPAIAHSLNPVSYTHLDVYKRQIPTAILRECLCSTNARRACTEHIFYRVILGQHNVCLLYTSRCV